MGTLIMLEPASLRKNKMDFSYNETIEYYENILTTCYPSDISSINEKLKRTRKRQGKSAIDNITDIIFLAIHTNYLPVSTKIW